MPSDQQHTSIPAPSKARRWDIDERGHGDADARRLAPRIGELQRAAEEAGWIAEEPEAHLWPHLEQAIAADGSPWTSGGFAIDEEGALVVDLVHVSVDGDDSHGIVLADTLRLLGLVLEGSTYLEIDQRVAGYAFVIDVLTGMLEDQTLFRGHGHAIRCRVRVG